MKTRLQEALDRQAQRRKPLPTDDEVHGCRGSIEWGLKELDHAFTLGGIEETFSEVEGHLIDACTDSYLEGRHDATEEHFNWRAIAWLSWALVALLAYVLVARTVS